MSENTNAQALISSWNNGAKTANNNAISSENIGLYQKCLACKDYGVSCNGPKLAALGDIMIVREFHRAIRDQRAIPMKLIYVAAHPISESTINDYFSHSEKDFKWTTVGCIDNALTAICGNRVGQPLLDNPCPASSSEIMQQTEEYEDRIRLQIAENERLRRANENRDQEYIEKMAEQRALFGQHIDLLTNSLNESKDTGRDYLARIDEKNRQIESLIKDRENTKRKNDMQKVFLFIGLVITLIALTCYVVWDLVHPDAGFFLY